MNSFWLGLLILMWRTFRSIEGAGGGCSAPRAIEFAEWFVESYKIGTKVNYVCDNGYKRPAGQARIIKCSSDQDGFGRWTTVICTGDPSLPLHPSTQPATQTGEENGRMAGPLTTVQPLMKDFCGVLRPQKHVRTVSTTFTVGQELQYRCLDGYQARTPISGKITCQNFSVWSRLSLRCTNNTMPVEEDITPETDVPNFTSVNHFETVTSPSDSSSFAVVIYPASVVFAIVMLATVVFF